MSMMQEGTYAHRAPLWKNGLIFMFLVYRIMTKIYGDIFTVVFYLTGTYSVAVIGMVCANVVRRFISTMQNN